MPTEIRITNARLKSLLVSLISFAIAAAASPLLFVGSLKAVLSGTVIVLFFLTFAVLLLYRAADARTKLVFNADGIRIVQAFTEEEYDRFGAKSGRKTKRENVFYPWEQINSVVFVDPFPATLYLSSGAERKLKAELQAYYDQPPPDNADLKQLEAHVVRLCQLTDSLERLQEFTIRLPVIPLRHGKHLPDLICTLAAEPDKSRRQAVLDGFCQIFFPKALDSHPVAPPEPREFPVRLPVIPLRHGKHLPDLICTLAAEPDKSRRQAVLDGFCQIFFPKALDSHPVAPPEPREFPVRLPAQISIRSIGGGYPLANILCALIVIGSLGFAAAIVRNAADPADIRGLLPLLPFAVITAAACGWQLSRYRRRRAVLAAINRPEAQPWKLVAIPIYIAGTNHKLRRTYYFYPAPINGKIRKITFSDHNFQPVRRHGQYLAFAPQGGGAPIPIDADLRNIRGLNESEHRGLLRQIKELAAE